MDKEKKKGWREVKKKEEGEEKGGEGKPLPAYLPYSTSLRA